MMRFQVATRISFWRREISSCCWPPPPPPPPPCCDCVKLRSNGCTSTKNRSVCEVQVREEDQVGADLGVLGREGLLHLEHHLGLPPDVAARGDRAARGDVGGVREPRAVTRRLLDYDLVATVDELTGTRGRQRDAILLGLDLLDDADLHVVAPAEVLAPGSIPVSSVWPDRTPRRLRSARRQRSAPLVHSPGPDPGLFTAPFEPPRPARASRPPSPRRRQRRCTRRTCGSAACRSRGSRRGYRQP